MMQQKSSLRGGAYLSGNGTTWTNASDKNRKDNFTDIDRDELLSNIAQLQITHWSYKEDDASVTHIGPMAQDFHALFGVGNDAKSISTIDPAGIALAAIQELHQTNQELRGQIAELREIMAALMAERQN